MNIKRFLFYLGYAARNLRRSRRWSSFAMLSVAAGVATVVALRSLGLAIGDSLTSNVRASNHGDITIRKGDTGPGNLNFGVTGDDEVFTDFQRVLINEWVAANDAVTTEYTSLNLQVRPAEGGTAAGTILNFISAIFIDPETYPPTDDIRALDPKGVPLSELFQGGAEVVISDNMAQSMKLEVGDAVRVSGTDETFLVRGIVPTETEAGLRELFAAFFGFVYFDRDYAESLGVDPRPNRISLILPEGVTHEDIEVAADELNDIMRRSSGGAFFTIESVPDLLEQNQAIADVTSRFIVVMGLGAMLLGGVGIINTMLVMIRRRTTEIATLKTFGLKGRQIALLFMTEALLLGVIGSLIGSGVGILLSLLTNAYGETFIQQPLLWRVYPEAILFGVALGFIVTGVFGVIPVLTAVRVRPQSILRPNETHLPGIGLLQAFVAIIFMVLSLGLITGQIVGGLPDIIESPFGIPLPPNLSYGIIGVAITLLILGLLVFILWIIVWIVGRLPAFGWIDMRLALTNLRSRRIRTATTLLAISVGMFALSSITFYGAGFREILNQTLSGTFGGNVLVLSPASIANIPVLAQGAERALNQTLNELDGVRYRTTLANYNSFLVEADGRSLRSSDSDTTRRELQEEIEAAAREGDFERMEQLNRQFSALFQRFVDLEMRDTNNPNLESGNLIAGRELTPEDRGQMVATLLYEQRFADLGIGIGSEMVLEIEGREYRFEIIGLIEDTDGPPSTFGEMQIPGDTLGNLQPDFKITTLQVDDEHLEDVMLRLSSMPGFFPLNIEFIDGIISRLINQFSALPLLVGILSLGAAAVIMANTVALATLERRKQIGILKAVGLKSKRVLGIMLLENVMVSLLGGFLGIGLSVIGVVVMTYFGLEDFILIPDDARPVAIILVVSAVVIGTAATILSASAAVRERVLNVLRYE